MDYRNRIREWREVSIPEHREERILQRLRQTPANTVEIVPNRLHRLMKRTWSTSLLFTTCMVGVGLVALFIPLVPHMSQGLAKQQTDAGVFPRFREPVGELQSFAIQSDNQQLVAYGYNADAQSHTTDTRYPATDVYVVSDGHLLAHYKPSTGTIGVPTWLEKDHQFALVIPVQNLTNSTVTLHTISLSLQTPWTVGNSIADITFHGLSTHKYDREHVLAESKELGDGAPTWLIMGVDGPYLQPATASSPGAQPDLQLYNIHFPLGGNVVPIHIKQGQSIALIVNGNTSPLMVEPQTQDGTPIGIRLPSPYTHAVLFRFNEAEDHAEIVVSATAASAKGGANSVVIPLTVTGK